jgi:peroxiredoxin
MSIAEAQHEAAEARWLEGWLRGPTRTRWEALPPQVGDTAPDLTLPDTTGAPRRLSELWAGGPLHLVFMRHFGCSCLADRWAALQDELPELAAAGATTVAIGQGEPERTAAVASRRGYPFTILCDPERTAFAAFGLLEGTPPTIVHDFAWRPDWPEGAEAMGRTARRGTERALVDAPWQLPGEFVIARDGRIALAHPAQFCEDIPAKGVLLGAIAAASS